ncbi:MAG: hypothetical protein LUE98_16090 [Tannerellaceae bacterium]|nr:hypothetical protein [Tannerellaceae bacterium]MCD8178837.1 hypothetical protein [Tannerellaceae bacterium]
MAITYKRIRRKVLSGKDRGMEKEYMIIKSSGTYTLDDVAKQICRRSRIHEIDVKRVFLELQEVIKNGIKEGMTIQLGNMGYFIPVLSSEGTDPGQWFSKKNIRDIKIQFRPGKGLKLDKEFIEFYRG